MVNFPCDNNACCGGSDNPLANLTSEAPDQFIFLGYNSGWDNNLPPLGDSWKNPNATCWTGSPTSQEEADRLAANCQIQKLPDDCETDCGKWKKPDGRTRPPIFGNVLESCRLFCADGLPFEIFIQPNSYFSLSQKQANAIAASFACKVAHQKMLCLGEINSEACLGASYLSNLNATGKAPVTFTLVSGMLPPGITMTQTGPRRLALSGSPAATGNYSFTIRAGTADGIFMHKDFEIAVLGITSPMELPDFTVGVPYSFQFTADGGTPPYVFDLDSGTLPDGLILDADGLLHGTPTNSDTFEFSVSVSDSA